jgi:hypothetical protein
MTELPEFQIVGLGTIPPPRYRWLILMQKNFTILGSGQALRVVMPAGKRFGSLHNTWKRLCRKNKKKMQYLQKKQADGSYLIWLWYEEEK